MNYSTNMGCRVVLFSIIEIGQGHLPYLGEQHAMKKSAVNVASKYDKNKPYL